MTGRLVQVGGGKKWSSVCSFAKTTTSTCGAGPQKLQFTPSNLAESGCAGANYVIAAPSPPTSAHRTASELASCCLFVQVLLGLSEPQQTQLRSQTTYDAHVSAERQGMLIRHVGDRHHRRCRRRLASCSAQWIQKFAAFCSTVPFHAQPPCSSGGPLLGMVTKKAADSFCRAKRRSTTARPGVCQLDTCVEMSRVARVTAASMYPSTTVVDKSLFQKHLSSRGRR
ncbi:hypothetical protein B0H65DRAFT_475431 [Neurospora tetraspora]|uniref:Uncharacterized protein n=1 Tax=Neurospora tetraspora TaxID=94610 RepID=A0AAE0JA31_9PEZI|nr:hypothetical protein B0H65DRAFT_475431 [Neurospora tetraspora]